MNASPSSKALPASPDMKKYRLAAYGFLGFYVVYGVLFYLFLPPFNLGFWSYAGIVLVIVLILVLTKYVYGGTRKLVLVLIWLYLFRIILSAYTMIMGEAFPVVPYIFPFLLVSFYLLCRAAWDWP